MDQMLSDEELITRLLTTQPEQCFEVLYSRYVHKVYRRCVSMVHDSELAQDLTQDIFLRVFTRLDKFRHQATFSTWLYAITFNYCSDQLRVSKNSRQIPIDNDLMLPVPDLDDALVQEKRFKAMQYGLEGLSASEQLLLKQKYEQGLSIQALALLHRIGESAVKMRLKRSRTKLQSLCAQFMVS